MQWVYYNPAYGIISLSLLYSFKWAVALLEWNVQACLWIASLTNWLKPNKQAILFSRNIVPLFLPEVNNNSEVYYKYALITAIKLQHHQHVHLCTAVVALCFATI